MATMEALITAEEFLTMPNHGQPRELVLGRIVELTPPATRHGQVCGRVYRFIDRHAEKHETGHVVCNDSGFITHRNPDSVRGPDVSYYGFDQIPAGPMPTKYTGIVPRLAIEVMSPTNTWRELLAKTAEYLEAGVTVACIVDPESRTVQVFRADRRPETLTGDMELKLPEVLGEEFSVPVNKFFE